jgi:hypothetical protein
VSEEGEQQLIFGLGSLQEFRIFYYLKSFSFQYWNFESSSPARKPSQNLPPLFNPVYAQVAPQNEI